MIDNLPRTGLPPQFATWEDYDRSVSALVDLGVIEDSSKIWWDLRPSHRFPTLEARIMDVQPRLEHALMLAALTQCLMRMLWRLRVKNQRWRIYDRFLIEENRWRAQRYGVKEGLIDFGRAEIVPWPELVEELTAVIAEDAGILGCEGELERAGDIVRDGTSATRQRRVCERRAPAAPARKTRCARSSPILSRNSTPISDRRRAWVRGVRRGGAPRASRQETSPLPLAQRRKDLPDDGR